jgi:multicomponent Na+:H+ antiporter subunit D
VWFILLFASAGVFHHSGIKIPFFAFFSHDSGLRPKEAPFHMLLAMGIAAFLCIAIGVYPWALYSILPFPVHYVPYAPNHVMEMIELLGFSALAFTLLMLSGIYPPEMRAINLDFDWVYRRSLQLFMFLDRKVVVVLEDRVVNTAYEWLFLNPIMFFAKFFKGVDTYVVDGTVNGGAKATYSVSKSLRKLQTGNLQDYMILFVIGILILACVIILLRGGI